MDASLNPGHAAHVENKSGHLREQVTTNNGRNPDQLKRMTTNTINRSPQGENALMPQNGVVPFQNETLNCTVRAVVKDGEPWFVAKDVCDALSIADSKSSLRFLEDDEKGVHSMHTLGGIQQVSIINESGLYSLILRSRKPEAKKFKKWVTAEVLPSIRKTGGYMVARPEETPEEIMARAMLIAGDTIKRQTERLKQLETEREKNAAYVIYGKSVEVANGSKLIGTYAKMLTQGGMIIGEKRLFALLRELGILGKTGSRYNEPCQYHIEKGYFRVTTRTITHSDGVEQTKITPRLLPKGQIWLTDKFYKLWNTNPGVFTPFVGKGSCLRLDMKEYIARGDIDDVA